MVDQSNRLPKNGIPTSRTPSIAMPKSVKSAPIVVISGWSCCAGMSVCDCLASSLLRTGKPVSSSLLRTAQPIKCDLVHFSPWH